MNQRKALHETFDLATERKMYLSENNDASLGYEHLSDMVFTVDGSDFSDSKLGRWLGWAQAAVVASGVATLEEMKQINLRNAND